MHMSFIVAGLALLGACASQSPPPAEEHGVHLAGTSWQRVDDENAAPHFPTIAFGEDSRASGFAGCNRWFASVTQHGEELTFGPVGTTRMACQADSQAATERSFLAALSATRYGHYDQDALVLLDESQQQIARFERTP